MLLPRHLHQRWKIIVNVVCFGKHQNRPVPIVRWRAKPDLYWTVRKSMLIFFFLFLSNNIL